MYIDTPFRREGGDFRIAWVFLVDLMIPMGFIFTFLKFSEEVVSVS